MLPGMVLRQSEGKHRVRKYCLLILVLTSVCIQVQAQNGWTRKRDMPTPRVGATASVVDGKIYVIGGANPSSWDLSHNEVYDPSANTWDTTRMRMPTPRGFLTSEVINGIIYAIGGGYPDPTNIVEAYDPLTDTWVQTASMPDARLGMKAGVVNGKIYIVGGNFNQRNCSAYDPGTNTWTTRTSMPVGGGALPVTAYNGLIYTFGGSTFPPWAPLSNVCDYNPQTDTWDTTRHSMPTPRFVFQTYLVGGKIYAIGGSQEDGTSLAKVEVYDPATDSWDTTKPDMPHPCAWFAGAVVNDKIYVIGGSPDWIDYTQEVWEYDPSVVGVDQETHIPERFVLLQNYPNPFNPSTKIVCRVASPEFVELCVYDVLGRKVATLVNEVKSPGTYEVTWDAGAVASGVYLCRLSAGRFSAVIKMFLLK